MLVSLPIPGFILHSAMRGVRAAGHSAGIADPYAEGFDPCCSTRDHAQLEHEPIPEDVRREQARSRYITYERYCTTRPGAPR